MQRVFLEALDEFATVLEDDSLRRHIVDIRRHFDKGKPLLARERKNQAERSRRVTALTLPGHDTVPDVAEAVWWQRGGSGLPTQGDASAEFAIPHPQTITGKARNDRSVRKRNRLAASFRVYLLPEKRRRIGLDACELLGPGS